MRRQTTLTLCVLSVFVLAGIGLAACGDDSDDTATKSSTTETTEATAGAGGAAVVKVTDNDKFGKILTDTQGHTLYVFLKDTGTTSTCTDACADLWPAVTATGTPTGDGVDADDLGTTTRPDGTTQVTFYGHPVYTYAADAKAGDTMGQGVGSIWYVVDTEGNAVKAAASGGSETTTTQKSGY
jgi:predicted lipoprotein with Yx(FWY)xxD motif